MTIKSIYISVIGLHFAVFSLAFATGDSGWDNADVKQLEQQAFDVDDSIVANTIYQKEQWVEDLKDVVFADQNRERIGKTISEYE